MSIAAVRALFRRVSRHAPPAPLTLTCYTKPGCTLCDKAREPVARVARSAGATVEWIDILSDPALEARWRERIPVICVGDTVLLEGKIGELYLRRALAAYQRCEGH